MRDGATDTLRRIRSRMQSLRGDLRRKLERLVQPGKAWADAVEEGLYTQREDRYLLAVRADRFDRKKGVVHDTSRSGTTLYVEPFEVLSGNNELRELAVAEGDEIRRLLDELSALVAADAAHLESLQEQLGRFDELAARVRLSRALAGSTPSFGARGERVQLHGLRHPLLWLQANGAHDAESARNEIVPLDLRLESPTRILLISGPNMGGKTVALKSIGLAFVMAMSGLDLCAEDGCVLPWIDELFVEIGDAQSLEDHLSTFAARLRGMDRVARSAHGETLVLIDEIGSGTDPEEGAALAGAFLRHLAARESWVVATTHLGALKVLAAEQTAIENASMALDAVDGSPLYELQIGVPGGSHGLATARRLGFHAEVLEGAERDLRDDALALDHLLAELSEELQRARAERRELEALRAEVERTRRRLAEEEREADGQRRSVEKRRLQELRALEGQARELIRELRRRSRSATAPSPGALDSLSEQARGVERQGDQWSSGIGSDPVEKRPVRLEPGSRVRHDGLGVVFRIAEAPRDDGTVVLTKGSWRMTAPVSQLSGIDESAESGTEPESGPTRSVTWSEIEAAPTEIDLRGRYVEEAMGEIDRALDRAVLAGYHEFRIIHGVGSGALQRAVDRHLRAHAQVRRHRLGVAGEGGRGVTVAELR